MVLKIKCQPHQFKGRKKLITYFTNKYFKILFSAQISLFLLKQQDDFCSTRPFAETKQNVIKIFFFLSHLIWFGFSLIWFDWLTGTLKSSYSQLPSWSSFLCPPFFKSLRLLKWSEWARERERERVQASAWVCVYKLVCERVRQTERVSWWPDKWQREREWEWNKTRKSQEIKVHVCVWVGG